MPGTFSTHLKKYTNCTEATEVFIWSLISWTSEWSAWVRSRVTQSLERWRNLRAASGGFIAVCLLIWNLLHLLGWDCTCKQPKWTICSSWQLPHIWNEIGGDPDVDAEQKNPAGLHADLWSVQTDGHAFNVVTWHTNKCKQGERESRMFWEVEPKQSWICGFATRRLRLDVSALMLVTFPQLSPRVKVFSVEHLDTGKGAQWAASFIDNTLHVSSHFYV